MVHFGAIIFCRTLKNYFGQFVWIEKKSHYYSCVSLHEAPTKKWKELFQAIPLFRNLILSCLQTEKKTNRERHKSAPYLRLKNSKSTSKCQLFYFTVPKKPKSWTLGNFSTFLWQNIKKIEGGSFGGKKFPKKSHSAGNNWKGGPFEIF